MLSHEMRTPPTTILGWAHMLRATDTPPNQVRQALAAIERNAQLQARLVDDLLDVSRIVSGKLTVVAHVVDFGSIVDAAVETMRGTAEASGIKIEVGLDRGRPPIVGDPVRLQQVVWNLLSNAIKFTGSGGRVDVRARSLGDSIELTVRDTGSGIPPRTLAARVRAISPGRAHGLAPRPRTRSRPHDRALTRRAPRRDRGSGKPGREPGSGFHHATARRRSPLILPNLGSRRAP
jgi:light-regulated signal transduction histidine kinase (bacteriophytochrome)